MSASTQVQPGFLKSSFPVFIPEHPALTMGNTDFEAFVRDVKKLHSNTDTTSEAYQSGQQSTNLEDQNTTPSTGPMTPEEVQRALDNMDLEPRRDVPNSQEGPETHPFIQGLQGVHRERSRSMNKMMLTANNDLAYRLTKNPLVDLFYELEEFACGKHLSQLLGAAWRQDPLSTLKIIFNARSIHIGKRSRNTAYRCFGWLAQNHPVTLLMNLRWLTRPIIEKKTGDKKEEEDDLVIIEKHDDPTAFDIDNGVAHGYWKDLLNLVVFSVNDSLNVDIDPEHLLNIKNGQRSTKIWDAAKAKEARQQQRTDRHTAALQAFDTQSLHRALHLTVARLFAEQLQADLVLLHTGDKQLMRRISLCSKWTPSSNLFHDKHTFMVSSIAEILHPQTEFKDVTDREIYLRHAREAYRKEVSALRKVLEVVERDISAEKFENIKYEHVPSVAMNQYASLFARKDTDRFNSYITNVAEGKQNISGATLLPSKLISAVRTGQFGHPPRRTRKGAKRGAKLMVNDKLSEMGAKVLDGQWNSLVKRVKESGKLENSMAVCDVSGSMSSPRFPDGTTPMDSSIGLSLLLAEITAPPFGGTFITFASDPTVEKVEGKTLQEKVRNLESAHWGYSTDFVAVFQRLILPMAREHKVKQEDMVKQVFVFSDMHFNSAAGRTDEWTTSYERIKTEFELYGYQMPQLIFWNLAGGRASLTGHGDPTAPKPVAADQEGTSLVSGYSQGMLKVFLDNGAFEDPEAEEEIVQEEVEEDGNDEATVQVKKKQKVDPMSTVRKAISHKAYSMLKVVD
ncbi:hypothetical protein LTS08_000179 [Lithohypha guttulata]|nr:hypothetical protein LTS08_000179 [Lithohypha guttulata]